MSGPKFSRKRGLAAIMLAAAALSACAPDARTGAAAGQPLSPPGRSATPYTEALTCLNEQLLARQLLLQNPTRLGAGTLPDATGRISPGLRDMVTTSMVRATRGSNVFRVSESLSLVQLPNGSGGGPFPGGTIISPAPMPTDSSAVQIYGALTQADRNVQGSEIRAGAGTTTNIFGISQNADIANIGLDMHLGHVGSGQILESVSNQMTVRNLSRGASADFTIRGVGANFAISFDEREGLHQAVRTLVELSVLELLGQMARVPYWHCFQLNRSNPAVQRQIAGWFRQLSPDQLDRYVRERLAVLGYQVPAAPASMMPAISTFQINNRLVPSGMPTFETFAALVDGQLASGPPGPVPAALPAANPTAPRRLRVDVTELAVAEPLLQISVHPDRVGNVVCYYRDDTGAVWRLFPSRHQPGQTINSDVALPIPAQIGSQPVIQPRRMTGEVGFLCATAAQDWSAILPAEAWGVDLSRLSGVTFAVLRQSMVNGGADVGIAETTKASPSGRWSIIRQLP